MNKQPYYNSKDLLTRVYHSSNKFPNKQNSKPSILYKKTPAQSSAAWTRRIGQLGVTGFRRGWAAPIDWKGRIQLERPYRSLRGKAQEMTRKCGLWYRRPRPR